MATPALESEGDAGSGQGGYRIVLGQLKLGATLGLFGHNFLALLGPDGTVLREINGLATSASGRIKTIGYLPGDRLKVYAFARPCFYRRPCPQAVLFEGDRDAVTRLMAVADRAAREVNALDLPYPFVGLGANSNSVCATLIAAMGLAQPKRLAAGSPLTPGRGRILLSAARAAAPAPRQ